MNLVAPESFSHISVLSRESIAGLNLHPQGRYLDATVGGGGHSELILASFPDLRVTAIDRDEMAIAAAKYRLATYEDRITFWHGNYADFEAEIASFDGIIADLGVSSPQLDLPERGFSFKYNGDLDMRMDRSQSLSATTIVNHWDEEDLANIFYQYGEERLSRRIARQIIQKRPLKTTTELAELVARCYPAKSRYGRIHPATRVFQGLRIAVNRELDSLETFLDRAINWLKPNGRIAIISFHSLEDRIVKYKFRDDDRLKVVTKKPLIAQEDEEKSNPRARSAKLRIAEKEII
jgi:16S rRNA (cytosine1402-N4)-methyltransferase